MAEATVDQMAKLMGCRRRSLAVPYDAHVPVAMRCARVSKAAIVRALAVPRVSKAEGTKAYSRRGSDASDGR